MKTRHFPAQTNVKFAASLNRQRSESSHRRKNQPPRRKGRQPNNFRLVDAPCRGSVNLLRVNSFPKKCESGSQGPEAAAHEVCLLPCARIGGHSPSYEEAGSLWPSLSRLV